jgi:hypothetical protein
MKSGNLHVDRHVHTPVPVGPSLARTQRPTVVSRRARDGRYNFRRMRVLCLSWCRCRGTVWAPTHREESMPFYERGPVRIHYEERGSGFPLMIIPGGGLTRPSPGSTRTASVQRAEGVRQRFRTVAADLRNANPASRPARSRSTGRGIPSPTTTSA